MNYTPILEYYHQLFLDKVIIQRDGVQAEYRALCEGCRKDTAVPKKSVATQTSSPRVKLEVCIRVSIHAEKPEPIIK